jgi:hypothetical protein
MIITYGITSLTVANPIWGYKSTIKTAMRIAKRADGTYSIYDPGYEYDIYTCTCKTFLHVLDMAQMIDIFLDVTKGRGQQITITPGVGFFPFGPYRGDAGPFDVKILNVKQSTTVGHPEDYVECELSFVFTGVWPYYAVSCPLPEGELTIATLGGLRWPNSQPKLSNEYGFSTQITHGPNAYIIDHTASMDCWGTDLSLVLNENNMAALQNVMLSTFRGTVKNIVPPANTYLLGVENSSTGTYAMNWIDGTLEIVHETHNRFSTSLTFHTT